MPNTFYPNAFRVFRISGFHSLPPGLYSLQEKKQQPVLLDPFFRLKQIIPSKENFLLEPTNETKNQSCL